MAAKSPENPSSFLPSDFFMADHKADPVFPSEFPYEFDVGSTETDSSSDEEVDFLAELTLRLTRTSLSQSQKLAVPESSAVEKKPESTQWVGSGSPQSTLTGIGSCSSNSSPVGPSSQVPSPPTTPFAVQNDTWDLIYAAAGEVARWKKMNSLKVNSNNSRGLLGPPRIPSPTFNQFQQVRQDQVLNRATNHTNGSGTSLCLQSQNAWPPLQPQPQHQTHHHPNRHSRPVLPNGSNVKRESTGTGVFLPRRYSNPSPSNEPPRKRSGCPTVLLPAKVVQAVNLSFEDVNAHHHFQPRFNNAALAPNHEALVARRETLLALKRRGLRQDGSLNYEVRLPQEWTY